MNIAAKSDSQKQHNDKRFIFKHSSGVFKRKKLLHPMPFGYAKKQKSCFAHRICSCSKVKRVKIACVVPYIAKFNILLGQQIKKVLEKHLDNIHEY